VLALNATVHVLQDGAIVQRGTAQDLRTAPATDFVAEFFATDL
jgi:ABC-type proline/glycine betaine transport system ATPase subunit